MVAEDIVERFLERYRHHASVIATTNLARQNVEMFYRLREAHERFYENFQDFVTLDSERRVLPRTKESRPLASPIYEDNGHSTWETYENIHISPDRISLLVRIYQRILLPQHRTVKRLSGIVRAINSHLVAIPAALATLDVGVPVDSTFFHEIYKNDRRFDPDLAKEVYDSIVRMSPSPEDVYRALNRVRMDRPERILQDIIKHLRRERREK